MNTLAQDKSLAGPSTSTQDIAALAARILLAALFILAGVNKIGGAEGTIGYIASVGLPFPELVNHATIALEIGAGVLLAIGLKARSAAAALGVFSILCAIIFHNAFVDASETTNFLKNFAIGGGMFALAAFGPGRFSLDRR
jgi:putative oxidoreductase